MGVAGGRAAKEGSLAEVGAVGIPVIRIFHTFSSTSTGTGRNPAQVILAGKPKGVGGGGEGGKETEWVLVGGDERRAAS